MLLVTSQVDVIATGRTGSIQSGRALFKREELRDPYGECAETEMDPTQKGRGEVVPLKGPLTLSLDPSNGRDKSRPSLYPQLRGC